VQGLLHRVALGFEPEDIDRMLDETLGEEQIDVFRTEPFDVQRAAGDLSCSTACAAQISSPVQRRRESSLPVLSLTSRTAGEPQTGQVCGNS
jgi:hypothetical protein